MQLASAHGFVVQPPPPSKLYPVIHVSQLVLELQVRQNWIVFEHKTQLPAF